LSTYDHLSIRFINRLLGDLSNFVGLAQTLCTVAD
jgi:hypothetical protein